MTGPGTSSLATHDLTHLVGPLTEESLVKHLQSRFHAGFSQTCIGPQLICVNGFTRPPELRVLASDSTSNLNSNNAKKINISLNSSASGAFPSPTSPQTPQLSLGSPASPLGLPTSPIANSSPTHQTTNPFVRGNINAAGYSLNVHHQQHTIGSPVNHPPTFHPPKDSSNSAGYSLNVHQQQPIGSPVPPSPTFYPPNHNTNAAGNRLNVHQQQTIGSPVLPSPTLHTPSEHDFTGQGLLWHPRAAAPNLTNNPIHMRQSSSTSSCSELQALHAGVNGEHQVEFMGSIVRTVLSQHADSFHPQVILVSGESGSGKTHCSMEMLRLLLEAAGGGSQTDAFKYLSAALTVVRSMTSALTASNADSSRVGMYIENLTSDCLVYRTKIHCLFVDMNRVTSVPRREQNFHIFHQMLAGLTPEERVKLHLGDMSVRTLRYLTSETRPGLFDQRDRNMFEAWKASISILGIPVSDVLRVLSSVLLLGNIMFVEGAGQELETEGTAELKSIAALLGVSGVGLYRGFTTQTRSSQHGQVCRTITDAVTANSRRGSLARALYFRTLSAILRRINSMKRRTSHTAHSTESAESRGSSQSSQYSQYYNKPDILHPSLPSFLGLSLSKKSSESFIGILDLFGFETSEPNRLEQLCANLCAEAMQHYYNTHVFRAPADALQDEGIQQEVDVCYFNNTPVIELLSAQTVGILSILDELTLAEQSANQVFLEKVRSHHTANNHFFEPLPKDDHVFGIRHFTGRTVYDASDFLSSNQDLVADDIVCVFSRQNCNFGFVSHLFSSEIQSSIDGFNSPCGKKFRLLSSSHQEIESPERSPSTGTLSKDFQSRLENILKSVPNAKPHFIRCIKSNDYARVNCFDCETVARQIRSLQVKPAVQLMAGGLPHRLRFKMFNTRYRLFVGGPRQARRTEPSREETKTVLTNFLKAMDESKHPYISTQWYLGRRHIFYSEGTRQSLETMRGEKIRTSANIIQATWRGHQGRKSVRSMRTQIKTSSRPVTSQSRLQNKRLPYSTASLTPTTPRPQLPPKGERIERVEPAVLSYVCNMWGLDPAKKPQVPPKRTYSVHGNVKISYPQSRCMKTDFPEAGERDSFKKGDIVTVLGPSATRGHHIVQKGDVILHVPYTRMAIQTVHETSGLNI